MLWIKKNVFEKFIVCIVNNLCDAGIVGTLQSSTDSTANERTQTLTISGGGEPPPRNGRVEQLADDDSSVDGLQNWVAHAVASEHSDRV